MCKNFFLLVIAALIHSLASSQPLPHKTQRRLDEASKLKNCQFGEKAFSVYMTLLDDEHPEVQAEVGEFLFKPYQFFYARENVLHYKKQGQLLLIKAAASNNLKAQALLTDTIPDAPKRIPHLLKLAEQGCSEAQNNLSDLYEGYFNDHNAAMKWVKAAAANNHSHAQVSLGFIYLEGKYVTKNTDTAVSLLEKAAKQYNALAINELVKLYRDEESSHYNLGKALYWNDVYQNDFNVHYLVLCSVKMETSEICQKLGDLDKALQYLNQAEKLNNEYHLLGQAEGDLFLRRGKIYLQKGDMKKAMYWLEYSTHFGLKEANEFYKQLLAGNNTNVVEK